MKIQLLIIFLATAGSCLAQEPDKSKFTVYDPGADAKVEIEKAVTEAKASGKHILIEAGGNWCKWCRIFNNWSIENKMVDSLLKADYVLVHLNFSKENKNPEVMKALGYPQRVGFPVFIILNENGERLHTQNSAYLEEGEGYSEKKVTEFLQHWSRSALDAKQYE